MWSSWQAFNKASEPEDEGSEMLKKSAFVSILILLTGLVGRFSFSQISNLKLEKATSLYLLDSPSEKDDLEAISLFEEVLSFAPEQFEASEFVIAAERLGNLYQAYGKTEDAVRSYRKAFTIKRAYQVPDSLIYNHHLYLGEALFGLSKLDSSLFHLQQAEQLQIQLRESAQPERLNNALGVYYFETGNYVRSISYFEKAESFLNEEEGEYEKYARYSFLSNKASALYRLEQYDSAQSIYSNLLEYGINTDQIRINLASTYIEEGKSDEAILTLKEISESYSISSTSYHNLLIKALLLQNELEQVQQTLQLAKALFDQDETSRYSFQKGIYYSLWGDYYQNLDEYNLALESYQKAVVQLLPGFDQESIEANPSSYSLGMSSLTLFEILVKKSKTAWELGIKDEQYFELGLESWRSAFGLAQFISVNFDNDEARIFLGEKALEAYEDGIDLLYQFSIQKEKPELMREAFAWAEQSKANGLKVGAKQESIKRAQGLPEDLIQEERNLLFLISRNNQKLFGDLSPENRGVLESERVDLQVQLSRLRQKFKDFPGFDGNEEELFETQNFQALLPSGAAVFSIFLSDEHLFGFWITAKDFEWKAISKEEINLPAIDQWLQEVSLFSSGKRFELTPEVKELAKLLFGDLEKKITNTNELIIIPQGVFNSFPFELLTDSKNNLLIEKVPISYQFSAQFIQPVEKGFDPSKMVGFAPFTGLNDSDLKGFAALRTSDEELALFENNAFFGELASKSTFFNTAQSAEVIHLATHAVASSDDPDLAFISFYPGENEFRLFAPELAYQSLENAKLVYLSACETGAGQLSKSEGLISLARSLAFAGAEQMVISQWVSEDQVSTYLANKFYSYALDGESFSRSLQLAKLDLINDPQMAQFHHPFFWANYRLIGQPSIWHSNSGWIYPFIGIVIVFLVGVWIWLVFLRRS